MKKNLIFGIIIITFCVLAVPALAGDFGLKATGDAAGLTRSDTIPSIVGNLIGAGLSLIGVLFFALMLFGGVTWMLSRGNQEMEKKALNTITGAIIGIIIVVASYAITNFVFLGINGNTGSTGNPSVECSGKTGSVSGCDTCVATKGEGWSCRAVVDCSEVEGEKVDNLCMASGQDSLKCCKAKAGVPGGDEEQSCKPDKSLNSFCSEDCTVDSDESCTSYLEDNVDIDGLCNLLCSMPEEGEFGDDCVAGNNIDMDAECNVPVGGCSDLTPLCKIE